MLTRKALFGEGLLGIRIANRISRSSVLHSGSFRNRPKSIFPFCSAMTITAIVYPWHFPVKTFLLEEVNGSILCVISPAINTTSFLWWNWSLNVCDKLFTGCNTMPMKPTNKKDGSKSIRVSVEIGRPRLPTFLALHHRIPRNACWVTSFTIPSWPFGCMRSSFGSFVRPTQPYTSPCSMHCRPKNIQRNKNEEVKHQDHRRGLLKQPELFFLDDYESDNNNQITAKRRAATIVARSVAHPGGASTMIPSTLTNDMHNQSYLATSLYSTMEGSHNYENGLNEEEDFDSLQYQYSSYGYEAFKLFQNFVRKLNNTKYLQYILYHWVIGNRLIIKYTNVIDNKDLIRALASVFRVRGIARTLFLLLIVPISSLL